MNTTLTYGPSAKRESEAQLSQIIQVLQIESGRSRGQTQAL